MADQLRTRFATPPHPNPCIFQAVHSSTVVVEAVGKWAEAGAVGNAQRCPRPAGRFELSSNCPLVHSLAPWRLFGGRCAKPVDPRSFELVGEHLVNAPARLVQPCSPNSCQS